MAGEETCYHRALSIRGVDIPAMKIQLQESDGEQCLVRG